MDDSKLADKDRYRILLVEDDGDTALEITDLCSLHGYELTHVSSARKLLAFIRDDDADIVICDIRLPDMSGIELMRIVRDELPLERQPQFIFITGHGDINMAVDALRLGAIDFLNKPLSGLELIKTIGRAILRVGHQPNYVLERSNDDEVPSLPADVVFFNLGKKILDFEMSRCKVSSRNLFGDPSWSLMLALFLADFRKEIISASNLSIDAGVPLSTSTRRLIDLEQEGFLNRRKDDEDNRRTIITMSKAGREVVRECLQEILAIKATILD
ncbi:MAG: response regulator [Bradyrhizobiaceae bacterium]|nr:MAG: response regulator [Bradyrhizobiaceae bacterium]